LCVQIDPTSGYKDIVAVVKQRFMPLATSMWLACDFSKTVRQKDESARDYLDRLQAMGAQAFADYDKVNRDKRILEQFVNGQDPRIKMMLAGCDVSTLHGALQRVSQMEEAIRSSGGQDPNSFTPYGYNKKARKVALNKGKPKHVRECDESDSTSSQEDIEDSARWLDNALDIVEHDEEGMFQESDVYLVLQAATPSPKSKRGRGVNGPCFYCKRAGHGWRTCYKLRNVLRENGMKTNAPFPSDTPEYKDRNKNTSPQASN